MLVLSFTFAARAIGRDYPTHQHQVPNASEGAVRDWLSGAINAMLFALHQGPRGALGGGGGGGARRFLPCITVYIPLLLMALSLCSLDKEHDPTTSCDI